MTTAAPLQAVDAFHQAAPKPDLRSNAQKVPSGDTQAELFFYTGTSDNKTPYNYVNEAPEGVPQSNIVSDPHQVTIHDLRGQESQFSLDKQAFATVQNSPTAEKDFTDDAHIEAVYYPEIKAILKKALPEIEEVVIFDHTIRRNYEGSDRRPVPRVHIDQTAKAGELRVLRHLPKERAEEVLAAGKRTRIINVWRPIKGPIIDHPLAVADSLSVKDEDVLGVQHIYPDRTGETAAVRHKEGQKWWYWSGQKEDEVLLIKCYDSDTKVGGGVEGRHGRTPHTAFAHPDTPKDAAGRESIEVRCLIVG